MLLCVCVMLLVASDLSFGLHKASINDQWEQWKITHGKKYQSQDHWEKNMHIIHMHNQEAEQGKHSYKLQMNHLGDTEIKNNITCSLPKSIDYREKGLVTRVKDQGHCGSCWAFSAAGALEGQLANKTGRLLDLSPQNLLDCVPGNNTCLGGHMTDAFMYVQQHGGISSEEDYPYTGQMQKCSYKPSARAAQCRGYELIPEGDECALAKALNEVGPLSVSISTGNTKFLFYKSGIYYNPKCDENELNHAMLLVGYGETAEGEKYWTLKNSHGESWGEKGYMRMARTHENHCGIASDASYPLM
ncbi:hypothetical protein Q5P01_011728 [Channa striata]|uniref:Cathepsin K n=1 Tax=Channa striata TaxID=64152 RepID=A0AA88SVZ5_CHASR|nr:hypothetical protein Q5P01_011728 [Channa striata]